jgi:DNA ligase-1
MLAKDYNPARVVNWSTTYVEPKMDGVRVIATVHDPNDDETVRFYSRNGRRLMMFEHLRDPVWALWQALKLEDRDYRNGVMLDGEMTGSDFGDISGAIHTKDYTAETAMFHCFAAIPLGSFERGCDIISQNVRYAILRECMPRSNQVRLVPHLKVSDDKVVRQAYEGFRRNGLEGAMVKDYSYPWMAKRTYAWMKMKGEVTLDIKIAGFKEGKGKYAGTLGALLCEHNGVRVSVSGMSDALRHEIWNNKKRFLNMFVEVEGHEETKHGSIRHPRFKRLRGDK